MQEDYLKEAPDVSDTSEHVTLQDGEFVGINFGYSFQFNSHWEKLPDDKTVLINPDGEQKIVDTGTTEAGYSDVRDGWGEDGKIEPDDNGGWKVPESEVKKAGYFYESKQIYIDVSDIDFLRLQQAQAAIQAFPDKRVKIEFTTGDSATFDALELQDLFTFGMGIKASEYIVD